MPPELPNGNPGCLYSDDVTGKLIRGFKCLIRRRRRHVAKVVLRQQLQDYAAESTVTELEDTELEDTAPTRMHPTQRYRLEIHLPSGAVLPMPNDDDERAQVLISLTGPDRLAYKSATFHISYGAFYR